MDTYLKLVERLALPILAVLFAVTAFFAVQLERLTADSNPYLLAEDHPARKGILDLQQEFSGTHDAVLVALYNPRSVFNETTLAAIYELTRRARRIKLVDEAADGAQLRAIAAAHPRLREPLEAILANGLEQNDYFAAMALSTGDELTDLSYAERTFLRYLPYRLNPIKEMAGMAATENVFTEVDGTLVVRKSLHDSTSARNPAVVRSQIMGNEIMVNGVVSTDERVALIVVEIQIRQDDAEGQLRAYNAFKTMVDTYRAEHPEFGDDIFIAGVPIFIAEQKALMDRDMGTLFPLVLAVVTMTLVLFFRCPLGVLLPLVNVVMCTLWTLGLMAVLQVPLDLITSVLPVFLITLCSADALHIMSDYYTNRAAGRDNRTATGDTMRAMVSPVVLTTVTTVLGFLVGTASAISSTRTFGLFMAVGLVVAQVVSLLLIPAWLYLWGGRHLLKMPPAPREDRLGPFLERRFATLIDHRGRFGILFAMLLVAAAVLATNLRVEDAGAEYFAADNPFRLADQFVNDRVAGTSPGWIAVQGDGAGSMTTLEAVRFLNELDRFLMAQEKVTYSYSLPKYIKHIFYVLNDMDPAFRRLPEKQDLTTVTDPTTGVRERVAVDGEAILRQSVLMYENGGGMDLENVLNADFSKAVTLFTMNTTRASDYQRLLDDLQRWLANHTPAGYEVTMAGTPVIWTGVLDELLHGQMLSFGLGLGAVFLVLTGWLRSLREGLLTTLPLALTIVCYYAVMTLAGIDLNIGTAIISFMVVGVVDYSVHFLLRTKSRIRQGASIDDALLYGVQHSGRSILLNVTVFSLGFLSLLFSEFTPIVHLGILVAVALTVSGLMSLLVITLLAPWMLSQRERSRKRPESGGAQPEEASV